MAGPFYTSGPSYIVGDPNFAYYDSGQLMNDSRLLGPQGYADAVAFWYRPDPSESMFDAQQVAQARQGASVSAEQVKHRRTRSGCYTCRSRRVKCDEKRPICARCKKGNRDCVYPEASANSKGGGRTKHGDLKASRQSSHSSDDEESEDKKALETIKDEDEDEDETKDSLPGDGKPTSPQSNTPARKRENSQSQSRRRGIRQLSESSSSRDITSPSTEASATLSGSQTPASSLRTIPSNSTLRSSSNAPSSARWSHLKHDLQTYLQYHQDNITFFHYFFKLDPADFIHNELIDLAVNHEPLLHAIVGFAAYHHTVRQPNGKLSTFLKYYSHSLSSLRKSIESGRKASEATICTILTLATFEEYLGDWVNLAGHQKAAHQLIVEMFTPDTIMDTEISRQIFLWCARFDVITGLLGAGQTSFGREWYLACDDWFAQQEEMNPMDLDARLAAVIAGNRLIGFDMAGLLSSLPRGTISMETFMSEYGMIGERIDELRLKIQALNNGEHTVTEFPNKQPPGPYDIVNPYVPGGLFSGPFFILNYAWIDWFAVKLMYRYQLSIIMRQSPPAELTHLAFEQCRIFESIERWPESPPGATLGAHASLGIASVFLPKEEKPTMWCRYKLASMEGKGYIYPLTFRTKMAEVWHNPEVAHWWLPNDERFHPILQSVRAFSEERSSRPLDDKGEDLRDMKSIFSKLNIGDDSPRDSSSSTSGSTMGVTSATIGQSPTGMSSVLGSPVESVGEGPYIGSREGHSPQQSLQPGRNKNVNWMSGIWEGGYAP